MSEEQKIDGMNGWSTHWQTVSLEDMIAFYVKGFDLADRIGNYESFVDPVKGTVVLRMLVRRDRHDPMV